MRRTKNNLFEMAISTSNYMSKNVHFSSKLNQCVIMKNVNVFNSFLGQVAGGQWGLVQR